MVTRSCMIRAGSASKSYSRFPSRLRHLDRPQFHNRTFTSSRCAAALGNDTSTPKNVLKQPSNEIPTIKEKLPNPERTPYRFREFDLEGKVFVVTGGGRGLGLVLAEALIEAGGQG